MNPNRRATDTMRPLASIPNKEGLHIIGIHKNGSEALLVVYVDESGFYKVPGYENLAGWRFP